MVVQVQHGFDEGPIPAKDVSVDTGAFIKNLSPADVDVQHALETIDKLDAASIGLTVGPPLSGAGTATDPITLAKADSITDGYLSMGDWSTFNDKIGNASGLTLSSTYVPYADSGNTLRDSNQFYNLQTDLNGTPLRYMGFGTTNPIAMVDAAGALSVGFYNTIADINSTPQSLLGGYQATYGDNNHMRGNSNTIGDAFGGSVPRPWYYSFSLDPNDSYGIIIPGDHTADLSAYLQVDFVDTNQYYVAGNTINGSNYSYDPVLDQTHIQFLATPQVFAGYITPTMYSLVPYNYGDFSQAYQPGTTFQMYSWSNGAMKLGSIGSFSLDHATYDPVTGKTTFYFGQALTFNWATTVPVNVASYNIVDGWGCSIRKSQGNVMLASGVMIDNTDPIYAYSQVGYNRVFANGGFVSGGHNNVFGQSVQLIRCENVTHLGNGGSVQDTTNFLSLASSADIKNCNGGGVFTGSGPTIHSQHEVMAFMQQGKMLPATDYSTPASNSIIGGGCVIVNHTGYSHVRGSGSRVICDTDGEAHGGGTNTLASYARTWGGGSYNLGRWSMVEGFGVSNGGLATTNNKLPANNLFFYADPSNGNTVFILDNDQRAFYPVGQAADIILDWSNPTYRTSGTITNCIFTGYVVAVIPSSGHAGSGYAVNDVVLVNGGNSDCHAKVLSVDGNGAVLTMEVLIQGSHYTVGSYVHTVALSGSGDNNLQVDCALQMSTLVTIDHSINSECSKIPYGSAMITGAKSTTDLFTWKTISGGSFTIVVGATTYQVQNIDFTNCISIPSVGNAGPSVFGQIDAALTALNVPGLTLSFSDGGNTVDAITLDATPASGYMVFTWNSVSTGHIPWDADSATIQAAIDGLLGAGQTLVNRLPSPYYGQVSVEYVDTWSCNEPSSGLEYDFTNLLDGSGNPIRTVEDWAFTGFLSRYIHGHDGRFNLQYYNAANNNYNYFSWMSVGIGASDISGMTTSPDPFLGMSDNWAGTTNNNAYLYEGSSVGMIYVPSLWQNCTLFGAGYVNMTYKDYMGWHRDRAMQGLNCWWDAVNSAYYGSFGCSIDTNYRFRVGGKMKVDGSMNLTLPTYADDAAAAVGGLGYGDLYQTVVGGDGIVKIKQ